MTAVWDHSSQKGSDLLVLLALADNAQDDGSLGKFSPGIETIARRARMTARSVQRVLSRLESSGELTIERVKGRTNKYRLNLEVIRESEGADPRQDVTPDNLSPVTLVSSDPRQDVRGTHDTGVVGPTTQVSSVTSSVKNKPTPYGVGNGAEPERGAQEFVAAYIDAGGMPERAGEVGREVKRALAAKRAPEVVLAALRHMAANSDAPRALPHVIQRLERGSLRRASEPKGYAGIREYLSAEAERGTL